MNPPGVTASTQRVMVWCTPVFFCLYGLGFLGFARWVPPPAPWLSMNEVAAVYAAGATSIKVAGMLLCFASPFILPIFVVLYIHMRRIEGRHGPLALVQLGMAIALVLEFVVAAIMIMGIAYRPGHSPDVVSAVNDIIWMDLVGISGTAFVGWVAIGWCILQDRRPVPIFPRWYGYLNLFVAIAVCGGTWCVLFRTGPLAWNGIIAYWLPLAVWIPWCGLSIWMLLRVIKQQEIEESDRAESTTDLAGAAVPTT